jgi:putative oxidoreductase
MTLPKPKTILVWALSVASAAIFLIAGTKKLQGDAHMVEVFDQVGFGPWFRYLIAVLEISGGISLLIPRLAAPAGVGLACVMVGATWAHLARIGGSPGLAIVLIVACLAIAWLRIRAPRNA